MELQLHGSWLCLLLLSFGLVYALPSKPHSSKAASRSLSTTSEVSNLTVQEYHSYCRRPEMGYHDRIDRSACRPVMNRMLLLATQDPSNHVITKADTPIDVARLTGIPSYCQIKILGVARDLTRTAAYSWRQIYHDVDLILTECQDIGYGGIIFFAPGFMISLKGSWDFQSGDDPLLDSFSLSNGSYGAAGGGTLQSGRNSTQQSSLLLPTDKPSPNSECFEGGGHIDRIMCGDIFYRFSRPEAALKKRYQAKDVRVELSKAPCQVELLAVGTTDALNIAGSEILDIMLRIFAECSRQGLGGGEYIEDGWTLLVLNPTTSFLTMDGNVTGLGLDAS